MLKNIFKLFFKIIEFLIILAVIVLGSWGLINYIF